MHAIRRSLYLLTLLPILAGCAHTPSGPVQGAAVAQAPRGALDALGSRVREDYRQGYSAAGLLDLLPPVAVHGILANTDLDRDIRDHWQAHWRHADRDRIAERFVEVGDYSQNRYALPLYSLGMLAGGYAGRSSDGRLATWSERSLRTNLLGAPQAWALTYALGTHRPTVGTSGWQPWNDNDGVSGHSFYGAVPFLTAARMSDSAGWRYSLFALSTLPGLARIHINKHYTSQAWLGWAIAFHASGIVARDGDPGAYSWLLLPGEDGVLLTVSRRF
ncbi:MAG: hypothetical protein R3217_09715 [Gammaproteobacteria bacterium]|nr:hypothetical protein [Gammaproteobacteria bacterium]